MPTQPGRDHGVALATLDPCEHLLAFVDPQRIRSLVSVAQHPNTVVVHRRPQRPRANPGDHRGFSLRGTTSHS
jgi:hypothetical protein